ncbi:hypothetical protein SAY87_027866 [Trapa incisa]|uniref:Uncharacterized protein n=1 Tax=Trapa incisa TaxID=236973 RepID=A0AAN7QNA5_9MYRT|nr:hypothetical protein SAY87_027866 [Trapa incisa]
MMIDGFEKRRKQGSWPRLKALGLMETDEGEREPSSKGVKDVKEGIASIALLPSGSLSGHFIHLPPSICYGLQGTELECERECSKGEDYRLIKLVITDYRSKKESVLIVECRGQDAARFQNIDHAHGWDNDVIGLVEEKCRKSKISVSFECETLKAEKAAEDHIRQFMPKLSGLDAVGRPSSHLVINDCWQISSEACQSSIVGR